MKTKIIVFFMMSIALLSAQNTNTGVKDHFFKANVLFPSLEYEMSVTKYTTFGIQLGIDLGSVEKSSNNEKEVEFVVFPTLTAYYRYYYNFSRRIRKGKNTKNNSANFFEITSIYTTGDTIIGDIKHEDEYLATIGAAYGFQRTYGRRFNLMLELGVGYSFSNVEGQVVPIADITLGWVLGK